MRLASRSVSAGTSAMVYLERSFSKWTNSSIWRKNHGSILVASKMLRNGMPSLKASYTWNNRFQLALRKLCMMASWSRNSRPSAPSPLRLSSSD